MCLRTIGDGLLDSACGVAVLGGQVYVAGFDGIVYSFLKNGGYLDDIDGSSTGTLFSPACDFDTLASSDTEIFLSDFNNARVVILEPDLGWVGDVAVGGEPTALDVDASGTLWVTDVSADQVTVITTGGVIVGDLDSSGSLLGQIDGPRGIVVDPSGSSMWLAESTNGRIQRFTELRCDGQPLTHVGTSFDDTFRTTAGDDVVHAGDGDDTIRGSGGDDLICAGSGADEVDAGGGADVVFGGAGDDVIRGRGGLDTLHGEDGADAIDGQGAADVINGGLGADTVNGQNGADTVNGGDGDDLLKTQTGPDILDGGPGDDTMSAGNGNDTLYGGPGFDRCSGNTGNGDQAEAASCEQTPGIEILF